MSFLGMFGNSRSNRNRQFGDGYDPATGAMNLAGGQGGGFFNKPVGRSILGSIGDGLLMASGNKPQYWPMQAEGNQQALMLQRQLALEQYKAAHPDPTGTMQNVEAAGLTPGTPEYQAFMQKILQQPHYMVLGNTDTGQTVIDANNPPPSGGSDIDPAAIARLKANPGEAALFDEHFGPGAAARVLGGQ
jgi:hypothetical protein